MSGIVKLFGGKWVLRDSKVGTAASCCCTGACCVDGVCSEETLADCTAAGGIWQGGGTTCADGDCTNKCCVESLNDDGCTITRCEQGYFFCVEECVDEDAEQQPTTGYRFCLSGTSPKLTVTGSGVTCNSGTAAYDTMVEDAMNTSYAFTITDCSGTAPTQEFYLDTIGGIDYYVQVTLGTGCGLAGRTASISVVSLQPINGNLLQHSMARSEGQRTTQTTACGDDICDCDEGVSGAPTTTFDNFGGVADFTNADITTS